MSNLAPGTSRDGSEVLIDRYTFESNWKSVYENFAINVNHEGFVHDDYKTAPNVPRVTSEGDRTYEEVDERGYHGLKFTELESDLAYGLARTPRILRKDGKEHDWNTIMTLYPNTDISLFPNFLLITVIMPQAPDSTGYDSIFLYPEEVAKAIPDTSNNAKSSGSATGVMPAMKTPPCCRPCRKDESHRRSANTSWCLSGNPCPTGSASEFWMIWKAISLTENFHEPANRCIMV